MRTIWSGNISFGLINVPVKVAGAVEPGHVSFNQIHKNCNHRIKYKKYCPNCDKEVSPEEIVKGYQVPGGVITVTEADLAKIPLLSLKTIELNGFIRERQIDSLYFQKPYYLVPNKSDTAYWLLYHSLKKTGKVGIAQFAVHSREHLALIKPIKNGLALCTLYYPDEIRLFKEVPVKPDAKHLDLAIDLIEQQTIDFNPEQYKNKYKENLEKMLEEKTPKVQTPIGTASQAIDIMEALKLSIKESKKKKKSA